jgi:hypothetical protein
VSGVLLSQTLEIASGNNQRAQGKQGKCEAQTRKTWSANKKKSEGQTRKKVKRKQGEK